MLFNKLFVFQYTERKWEKVISSMASKPNNIRWILTGSHQCRKIMFSIKDNFSRILKKWFWSNNFHFNIRRKLTILRCHKKLFLKNVLGKLVIVSTILIKFVVCIFLYITGTPGGSAVIIPPLDPLRNPRRQFIWAGRRGWPLVACHRNGGVLAGFNGFHVLVVDGGQAD